MEALHSADQPSSDSALLAETAESLVDESTGLEDEVLESVAPKSSEPAPAISEDSTLDAVRELAAQLRLATEPDDEGGSTLEAARELMAELRQPPAAGDPEGGRVKPPSLGLLLIEGRAVGELATTYALMPLLKRGPRGDGRPVLVLPGFLASDVSTAPLRKFLNERGYSSHPWKMGRNLGPREGVEDRLMERLLDLRHRYGRRVSLIGWSLGGIYARLLANRSPSDVQCVITLGTPFGSDPKANNSWRLFEWVSGQPIDRVDPETFRQIRETPPVPTTSVYSRTDGVTSWRCCVDQEGPQAENIEVPGSHCGLGANPLVLHAVLDRLGQPRNRWQRFQRSGFKRLLYPRPWGRSVGHAAPVTT